MEEMQNQEAPKMSSIEEAQEEQELSHTDKLVGLFTEPITTFGKIAKFPPKTSDWLIPIIVAIVVAILSQFVMLSNPEIKQQQHEKMMEQVQKQMDEAVASGRMTQAQADEQMSRMEDNSGSMAMFQTIGIVVGIPIAVFIIFFILSGFYLLVAKLGLKGIGTYKDTMVAYGLPSYISILQSIIMVIGALVMNKLLTGVSVADFIGADKSTMAGFFLGKLDPFSIWYYVVFGIALAKMHKAEDYKKYIIAIVAVWIVFSFLFHLLAKAVPFLAGFGG